MVSQPPEPVLSRLTALLVAIDEGLQADGHQVSTATAVHEAFNQNYVDSTMTRALVCSLAKSGAPRGVRIEEVGLGGFDICIRHEGEEWRFRLRRARLDRYGRMVVYVSSDSLLKRRAVKWSLFDQDLPEVVAIDARRWVVAYLLHPTTRTMVRAIAAFPVDVANKRSPFRLLLDNVIPLDLTPPTPPPFRGGQDDLDIDEGFEEDSGEDAG